MIRYLIIVVAMFGFTSLAHASKPSVQELQAQCEAAREAKLAPERQMLIQECIQKKEKTPEKCERFYADHGAGGRTAGGAGRVRLYNDLPECKAQYQAEKEQSSR